jgi:hypothetical protein
MRYNESYWFNSKTKNTLVHGSKLLNKDLDSITCMRFWVWSSTLSKQKKTTK